MKTPPYLPELIERARRHFNISSDVTDSEVILQCGQTLWWASASFNMACEHFITTVAECCERLGRLP